MIFNVVVFVSITPSARWREGSLISRHCYGARRTGWAPGGNRALPIRAVVSRSSSSPGSARSSRATGPTRSSRLIWPVRAQCLALLVLLPPFLACLTRRCSRHQYYGDADVTPSRRWRRPYDVYYAQARRSAPRRRSARRRSRKSRSSTSARRRSSSRCASTSTPRSASSRPPWRRSTPSSPRSSTRSASPTTRSRASRRSGSGRAATTRPRRRGRGWPCLVLSWSRLLRRARKAFAFVFSIGMEG